MREIPVTDVGPVCVGQTGSARAAAGCTVFIAPEGMRAGPDVRGGAVLAGRRYRPGPERVEEIAGILQTQIRDCGFPLL